MKNRSIRHMVGKRNIPLIGTFDIETNGIGGIFIAGMTYLNGEYKLHKKKESLFKELISYPSVVWYAHNSMRFDMAYMAPELKDYSMQCKRPIELIHSGVEVIGLVIRADKKKDAIEIRDSFTIMSCSLEDAINTYAPHTRKLVGTIDFDSGEVFDVNNKDHIEYLKRDVDGLYDAIIGYYSAIKKLFKVVPSWTPGGTSMRAWKATIPPGTVYYRNHTDKEKFVRNAYYGGFIYPGPSTDIYYDDMGIDRSAAFAAAMREGVPCGNGTWTTKFHESLPGIYLVSIDNPYNVTWPFLPYRDKLGMHWTTESCDTYLTSKEIIYYRSRGYSINVIEGIVYRRLEFPFNKFLDMCEEFEYPDGKRAPASQKNAAKSLRTALYGKFGTREEQPRIIMTDNPPMNEGYEPFDSPITGQVIDGLWVKHEEINADNINPHWAAWITATQRLEMFRLIEAIGVENIHYADTDGVNGERDAIERALASGKISTAIGYGNYAIKGYYEEFQVLGPKNYHGVYASDWYEEYKEEHKLESRYFSVSKGIPQSILKKHPEYMSQASDGAEVSIDITSMKSLRTLIFNPSSDVMIKHNRKISTIDTSVAWMRSEGNKIVPRPLHGKQYKKPQFTMPVLLTAKDAVDWLLNDGMSTREISRKSGVTVNNISRIHNGTQPGGKHRDTLVKLAMSTFAHKILPVKKDNIKEQEIPTDDAPICLTCKNNKYTVRFKDRVYCIGCYETHMLTEYDPAIQITVKVRG